MALTITNHLTGSADAPYTAGPGDGGGTVTWLPGRMLTEGRAAVMRTAEVASQIPAGCNPEVHDQGFWPGADTWARRHGAGIRGAGAG